MLLLLLPLLFPLHILYDVEERLTRKLRKRLSSSRHMRKRISLDSTRRWRLPSNSYVFASACYADDADVGDEAVEDLFLLPLPTPSRHRCCHGSAACHSPSLERSFCGKMRMLKGHCRRRHRRGCCRGNGRRPTRFHPQPAFDDADEDAVRSWRVVRERLLMKRRRFDHSKRRLSEMVAWEEEEEQDGEGEEEELRWGTSEAGMKRMRKEQRSPMREDRNSVI